MESTLKELLTYLWDSLSVKPGRSVIAPGVETVWDDCCSGQLAVRLAGSRIVYSKDICPIALENTIEVELVRCVASLEDDGEAPSENVVTADALQILKDMRELGCALQNYDPTDKQVHRVLLSEYTPTPLEGGCGGGKWSLTMRTGISWLA